MLSYLPHPSCNTHLIPRFDPKRPQHRPDPRTVRAEDGLDGYAFARRYAAFARHQRERLLARRTRMGSGCGRQRRENAEQDSRSVATLRAPLITPRPVLRAGEPCTMDHECRVSERFVAYTGFASLPSCPGRGMPRTTQPTPVLSHDAKQTSKWLMFEGGRGPKGAVA